MSKSFSEVVIINTSFPTEALKEFCEAEETEIITCEYCKEEIESVNQIAKINYPDKNFCCLGCVEKYEEKQKREKFQTVELPQDTIQRLCKTAKDQQEEIETLKTENDNLIIENTDLKKYIKNNKQEPKTWKEESYIIHLKSEAKEKQDVVDRCNKEIKKLWNENKELESRLYKLNKENENLKNLEPMEISKFTQEIEKEKIRADGYRRNSELLASEQAGVKLEKRQAEERLKKAGRFIADALKLAEADSSVFVLLQKVKEIVMEGIK